MNIPGASKTLAPRREPVQDRGRRRVDAILDAVSAVLVEHGFEATTTRLVAEEAGIPVGSIYQFFPNKYALFSALAARHFSHFNEVFQDYEMPSSSGSSLVQLLDSVVERLAAVLLSRKDVPVLWAAMRISPELSDIETQGMRVAVSYLERVLGPSMPGLSAARRRLVAETVVQSGSALLYHACHEREGQAEDIVREVKRVLRSYLGGYIEEVSGP